MGGFFSIFTFTVGEGDTLGDESKDEVAILVYDNSEKQDEKK